MVKSQKQRQHEQDFHQLAEALPQIVWTTNAQGEVQYYNARWYEYTGLDPTEKLLSSLTDLIHPEDIPLTTEKWQHSIATGESYKHEFRLRRGSDGKYIWHLGLAYPVKNKAGKITKWFGTSTNIHEHKLVEQRKDDFISIASHELKTPLTSIKGYGELLERSLKADPTSQSYQYLNTMLTHIDRLDGLINDLLDVSRLQSGSITLAVQEFTLSEVIKQAMATVEPLSQQHTIIRTGTKNLTVSGDKARIEQVIVNLLTNAIKYSPDADKVEISVGKDEGAAIITVSDYGVGIPIHKQHRIFERFYRAEETSSEVFGLGIGLYICAQIIRRHSGEIWVESKVGQGSRFIFTLPLKGPNHNL